MLRIEALMKVMRAKNVPFTQETVRRQFLDLWGVEMHADSRREAFTPDRIGLLSAAFRNLMHWSELIGGDVVIFSIPINGRSSSIPAIFE